MVNFSSAQDLIIFPGKGQTQEQQSKDTAECHQWAVNQSGYDPAAASAPASEPQAARGGLLKGAARGALAGVAVGAIAGNAGKGAAIGATAGGIGGTYRRRDQQREMAVQQQNMQARQDADRDKYMRAKTACLEAKGYTVK